MATLLSDYITDVRNLVHDPNAADFTTATLINFVNQGRRRVALDTQCVQTYLTGLNTITQQEVYPLTGFVGGVALTAGGTGYTAGATISFTGGGGTGAAAIAVIVGGVLTGINMTSWGIGYTSTPLVVISASKGSGAAATAITGINIINWLQPVDILCGNLRVNFRYVPFVLFDTFMRAYQLQFGQPGVFTVHLGNQQTYLYPVPDAIYPLAANVSILPADLVNLTDADNQVLAPWNDAVKLFAAHLCLASLQNYAQASYWYSGDMKRAGLYDLRVRQLPAAVTPYRISNPYALGRKRMRRL